MTRSPRMFVCEQCGVNAVTVQGPSVRFCSIRCGKIKPVEQRFWAKVEKTEDCWWWRGAMSSNGYGSFNYSRDVGIVMPHQASWLLLYGQLPPHEICHTCDHPTCVRPDHLFAGTHLENMHDAVDKGRTLARAARGERNGGNKYPESTARLILSLSGTASVKQIATQCGVSEALVYAIQRGDVWKHLHD